MYSNKRKENIFFSQSQLLARFFKISEPKGLQIILIFFFNYKQKINDSKKQEI